MIYDSYIFEVQISTSALNCYAFSVPTNLMSGLIIYHVDIYSIKTSISLQLTHLEISQTLTVKLFGTICVL